MSTGDHSFRVRLEQAIKHLEEAWKTASEPDLAQFLPADSADPAYGEMLAQLVAADQEYRKAARRSMNKEADFDQIPWRKEDGDLLNLPTATFAAARAAGEDLGPTVGRYRLLGVLGEGGFGAVYQETGRAKEAEAAHKEALAIRKLLAEKHPEAPDYRRFLAASYHDLAIVYQNTGRAKEAEAANTEADDIRKTLAERHLDAPNGGSATD